jgi:hypothetical protein
LGSIKRKEHEMNPGIKKWVRLQLSLYLAKWNASEEVKDNQIEAFINTLDAMIEADRVIKEMEVR